MKFNLRTLSSKASLKGRTVIVRVDWNVPTRQPALRDAGVPMERDASLKIERSIPLLKGLKKRGAKIVVLTHLGRPAKRDRRFSTKPLVALLRDAYGLELVHHAESVTNQVERATLASKIALAVPGSIHLLENVRFLKGEEQNDKQLAQAYAELGDLFVNDAFASCHRAHVSVVGIAKLLPSYAGPSLVTEVSSLVRLLDHPKSPFVAVIGGVKLSTKLPVIEALCRACDRVMIGGAMATAFFKAQKIETGKSVFEKEGIVLAKKLLNQKNLLLPEDVVVTTKVTSSPALRRVSVGAIGKQDMIVDVGPKTLKAWGDVIGRASTLVWNGPVGLVECAPCGFGSRFLARTIGARAKGKAFGVAGGGDTLPVIHATKTEHHFDFVSTGGGAMLDFLALKGKLPGLMVLLR